MPTTDHTPSRVERLVIRADITIAIILLGLGTLGFLSAVTSSEGGPAMAFYLIASPLMVAIGVGLLGAASLLRRGSAWGWVAQIVLPIVAPMIVWPALALLG